MQVIDQIYTLGIRPLNFLHNLDDLTVLYLHFIHCHLIWVLNNIFFNFKIVVGQWDMYVSLIVKGLNRKYFGEK